MFVNPGVILTPWVVKKVLQKYRTISTQTIKSIPLIIQKWIQETLGTIIGEGHSEAIKKENNR